MEHTTDFSLYRLIRLLLAKDKNLAFVIIIYGVVVGLLTLSVPLSVQMLIETVTNTVSTQAIISLSSVLLILLLLSAIFVCLQLYIVELFERRFYSRMCSEISLRSLYADPKELESFNAEELQNRYFEIMTIQSLTPPLLVGGLTLLETTFVGFLIVSLYHPFFFYFLLFYACLVLMVWRLAHRRAMRTALENSSDKFRMAGWLENIAKNNNFFRGERKLNIAVNTSKELTDKYLDSHRRHFHCIIFQNIGFLLLYAIGSASLLGLGGWLVVQNQLTIGQLVAAELVLSGIFAGLSRFGDYLKMYYKICAALNKLSAFFDVKNEVHTSDAEKLNWESSLRFDGVKLNYRNMTLNINAKFEAHKKALVTADKSILVKTFCDLAQAYQEPDQGHIWFGKLELQDLGPHQLRDEVYVMDSFPLPESTIKDYLLMANPSATHADMIAALELANLKNVIELLEDKLDQQLTPKGYPLSPDEILRLKISHAILARPKILILTPVYDILQLKHRARIIAQMPKDITLIYLSNRRDVYDFDHYYFLEMEASHTFDSLPQLIDFEDAKKQAEKNT